jgi:hypothetical protein
MEARVPKSPVCRDWREIYKAALFEDDKTKIPQRIAEAEKALEARALELYSASDDQAREHQAREQQAMENAKYFLRVLGNTQAMAAPPTHYVTQKQQVHLATM